MLLGELNLGRYGQEVGMTRCRELQRVLHYIALHCLKQCGGVTSATQISIRRVRVPSRVVKYVLALGAGHVYASNHPGALEHKRQDVRQMVIMMMMVMTL